MSRHYKVILNLPTRSLLRRLQVEGIEDLQEKLRDNAPSQVSEWEVWVIDEWFILDEHSWEEVRGQDTLRLKPHSGKHWIYI